jgi:hypothetical protein
MSRTAFWIAVQVMLSRYKGSETSGARTPKHNEEVGGKPDSPHLVGLGQDVVWDDPPRLVELQLNAQAIHLVVIRDKDHDHFQPADWIARKEEYLANPTDQRA